MSNPLKVIYPNGAMVWIGQCPAECTDLFGVVLNELFLLQHEHGDPMLAFNDAAVVSLVRYVASFLPILPWREKTFDVEPFLVPLNVPALSQYFYGVDCAVAQMHLGDPEPEQESDEEIEEDYSAVPSSGNAIADLLARLTLVDENSGNAMQLIRRYDQATLQAYLNQIYESRRDPKERFEEYKGKLLQKFVDDAEENNPMLYAELYGIGNQNVTDQSQD
jgi:hypothetical protein